MSDKFSRISSRIIETNPYWNYKLDEYKLPSGANGEYHYVDSRGSTLIIPELDKNKIILTTQFRYLNQKESIELPGGGLALGLSYEENALKELEEETGYTAGKMEFLGEFNPFNGVTNEICKVYLATELSEKKVVQDETESITISTYTPDEIFNLITSNKIWDGMSISAYLIYTIKKNYQK
jgi:ADP-ribose pyrophosphatase